MAFWGIYFWGCGGGGRFDGGWVRGVGGLGGC